MIVDGGDNDWEAQKRNRWTATEMYHIFVEMIGIFDTQQTWIDAGKISYSSNLIMTESDKGFNISNPPLMPIPQNNKALTHSISGDLYKDLICENL